MTQKTIKGSPVPTTPTAAPAPVPAPAPTPAPIVIPSRAQDICAGISAANQTAQTMANIYGSVRDRQEQRFNTLVDRQAARFDKAAELVDAAVSDGKLPLMEASAAYAHIGQLQNQEALNTLHACEDAAVKESTAGRNWLWGAGGCFAGLGLLAWGFSKGNRKS